MFKKLVSAVEVLALVAALGFVVALFTGGSESSSSSGYSSSGPRTGTVIYAASCAVCHGANGDGGTGPKLSGGAVVEAYPNVEDQVKLVEDGRGGTMPAFADKLSASEIRAVVDYTRTGLG